ncbi:MAG: GGDEF domain-containing protein [Oscillospiraceae bacterium]|nr:GGDEF domain-containing protein [Oscillospiraceae bacterium]
MSGFANVELNAFSELILLILLINMHRANRKYLPDQKLFLWMLASAALVLAFDSVQWIIDGIPGEMEYYVNLISTVLYYLFSVVPCMLWCFYVRYQFKMNIREAMRAKGVVAIPFLINAVMAIMTFFNGAYFYIDEQNYYCRGEYYWLSVCLTYSYFLYALLYTVINKKNTEKKIFLSLLIFPIPPIIGSVLQVTHFGVALFWPGVAIALLTIYLNIQKNQLYTDHLTGLYNRRLLDIHLSDCLKNSKKQKSIGVIMLDVDQFKAINDEYGHVIGDQALVETANVLKKSVGVNGFIARYGGDEFVAIVSVRDKSDIDRVVQDIELNVARFNERSNDQFKISVSMGCEIFTCGGPYSENDVLNLIDRGMYEDKKRKETALQPSIIR